MAIFSLPLSAGSRRPDNVQGVMWALVSTGLFTAAAAAAKALTGDYHVLEILFFRQIFVLMSTIPGCVSGFPESLKFRRWRVQLIRLFGAFTALSCGFWAVAVLPLTMATTLTFAQVFFVTLLAHRFLGEPITVERIGAIVVGFIGVVIVMNPSAGDIFSDGAFIPILGAIGAATAVICVRTLSQTENTSTLLFYQAIFVGVLAASAQFWVWRTPDAEGLLLLALMGVLSAAAQWAGMQSLRVGEASVVANIEYAKLIYAALLGFVLFLEIPSTNTIVGGVVIVLASAYVVRQEAAQKRRAARAASSSG